MVRLGARVYMPALTPEEWRAVRAAEEEAYENGHRWHATEDGAWHHANEGNLSLMVRVCSQCSHRIEVDSEGKVRGTAVVFRCKENRHAFATRMVKTGVFPPGAYYKGRRR